MVDRGDFDLEEGEARNYYDRSSEAENQELLEEVIGGQLEACYGDEEQVRLRDQDVSAGLEGGVFVQIRHVLQQKHGDGAGLRLLVLVEALQKDEDV